MSFHFLTNTFASASWGARDSSHVVPGTIQLCPSTKPYDPDVDICVSFGAI